MKSNRFSYEYLLIQSARYGIYAMYKSLIPQITNIHAHNRMKRFDTIMENNILWYHFLFAPYLYLYPQCH
jgi:hypothetical protein